MSHVKLKIIKLQPHGQAQGKAIYNSYSHSILLKGTQLQERTVSIREIFARLPKYGSDVPSTDAFLVLERNLLMAVRLSCIRAQWANPPKRNFSSCPDECSHSVLLVHWKDGNFKRRDTAGT